MIFIGSIYPQKFFKELLLSKSHIDFAANTFQTSLIEGFSRCYDDITVVTSPVTSTFPKSKELFFGESITKEHIGVDIKIIFTGFINVPLIKMASEYFRVHKLLKKQLCEDDTVYVYALHSPFLLAISLLRKKISKVCVIVPDLPQYMSNNNGVLRRFLKKINKIIINHCLKQFDDFVLLSPYMKNYLPIEEKKWIQVEGIYAADNRKYNTRKETKKTILYSGIISSNYGVFDLIEAFRMINGNDYQLWICGSCPDEYSMLEKYISEDIRIKYLGMLDKAKVRELQSRATLLVNPRHSTEEFTKYSFPSKTMEYLASGTTTLMCKLPAIPDEYKEYLFFSEDESIEGISKRIIEICNMDQEELNARGQRARNFILSNKNCFTQAKRIVDMVEHVTK